MFPDPSIRQGHLRLFVPFSNHEPSILSPVPQMVTFSFDEVPPCHLPFSFLQNIIQTCGSTCSPSVSGTACVLRLAGCLLWRPSKTSSSHLLPPAPNPPEHLSAPPPPIPTKPCVSATTSSDTYSRREEAVTDYYLFFLGACKAGQPGAGYDTAIYGRDERSVQASSCCWECAVDEMHCIQLYEALCSFSKRNKSPLHKSRI